MKTIFILCLKKYIKKYAIFVFLPITSISAFSQVGINTTSPMATLDVVADPSQANIPVGIMPPRISGNDLKTKDNDYSTSQSGCIVYVTSPVTTASTKTTNVGQAGYYYFNGSIWTPFVVGTLPASSSSQQGAVKINVNQSNFITLSGTQSYGLLMQNQSVTINPSYVTGVYPGGSGVPTDVILQSYGNDGALILEAPSSGKGNFFRMNMQYVMGNTPPAQTRFFNVRIESKGSGALIYENSFVVPGGLNTGHIVPFQIFFPTIADAASIGVGYRIVFIADTAASTGLPGNIGVKIVDIVRINQ